MKSRRFRRYLKKSPARAGLMSSSAAEGDKAARGQILLYRRQRAVCTVIARAAALAALAVIAAGLGYAALALMAAAS
jgi:hypothetical protein